MLYTGNHKLISLMLIGIFLCVISCSDIKKQKQIQLNFSETTVDTVNLKIDSIIKSLPNFNCLIIPFTQNKTVYNNDVFYKLNTDSIIGLDINNSALSMGILSANLVYAREYNKVSKCKMLIDDIIDISENLSIPNEVIYSGIDIAETNIENPDIFFNYCDSIVINTQNYFVNNETYVLTAILLSAILLESIRMSEILNQEFPFKNEQINNLINSQIEILNNISNCGFTDSLRTEIKLKYNNYKS